MTDTSTYNRPWRSFDEQLSLLEARGMQVLNREWALA